MTRDHPSWRAWAGLVAAPAAWVVHHQLGSDLNFADCARGDGVTLVLVGLASLAVALAAGGFSLQAWRRAPPAPEGGTPPVGRFLATLSLMSSFLFSLVIITQILAALTLPPCFR